MTELDDAVLCDGCIDRAKARETIAHWPPTQEEPSPPPEERFAELEGRFAKLFKAAQVLLRESIAEEDLIYPTLAYANELGQEIPDFEEVAGMLVSDNNGADWERAVERFRGRHACVVPEQVVDGVVMAIGERTGPRALRHDAEGGSVRSGARPLKIDQRILCLALANAT